MPRVRPLDTRRNPTTLPLLILTATFFGTLVGIAVGYVSSIIIN